MRIKNLFKIYFATLFVALAIGDSFGAYMPNPRSATNVVTSPRGEGREVRRAGSSQGQSSSNHSGATSRAASSTVVRSVTPVATARPGASSGNVSRVATARSGVRGNSGVTSVNAGAATSRAASSTVVRSAAPASSARGATSNVSRAAMSRATAVFDDVSKIGGGYAACREAYATCMDQFCAKANDTYRRCFCSSKYTEFRDTEAALDQAKSMLMQFQNNNLDAVDKTAAEVNAMYSATVGEQAIKNDTSGAANILNEIGDLLSGKKKADSRNDSNSLGILSLDFSTDMDDIWSGGGTNSIFAQNAGQDLSQLEGQKLYNSANSQCLKLVAESCENDAVFSMARSSYNILISQDCNAYEKKVNNQREAVSQTVRQAEKMLREARLEEYRSHNSMDVNECISKVKTAITQDVACGANYKKCLDFSGVYINSNTGEPIYSPRLFKLVEQINLDGESPDVLGQNPRFNQFLDSKRIFATTALDTCRDIADTVWEEFKRSALIEISQAQDEKIEEVKMSCVSTMGECYDTQTDALQSFDNTTAQYSGAASAYAARAMCQDKVAACAALYAGANDEECRFDSAGRLINGATCGLTALVSFVQTVDNVRVAEGCETGLQKFVDTTCQPASGDTHKSPWGCRLMNKGAANANYSTSGGAANTVRTMLQRFVMDNCTNPSEAKPTSYSEWNDSTVKSMVETTMNKIVEDIDYMLYEACEEAEGLWVDEMDAGDKLENAFYSSVYNGQAPTNGNGWGYCVQNTVKYQCQIQDAATGDKGYAKFNSARNECEFTEEWYQIKCDSLGGYYEDGICYI